MIKKITLFFIAIICLGGCGKETVIEVNIELEDIEEIEIGAMEITFEAEPSVEEEYSVDETTLTLEEPAEDDVPFIFVDVYGNEYEITIDREVKKSDYITENFLMDGKYMSYIEDERYDYRIGIDVSKYQGNIDWNLVKESEVEFVFIRLGYRGYGDAGTLNVDAEFEKNYAGAKEAGLDIGVYFFAQAISEDEAREEAEFVLQHLRNKELELPIVYDPETIEHSAARTDHVTKEQFTENTIAFCEEILAAGYEPMIYCNMLWQAYLLDLTKLSSYPIWYADYEPYPQTPYAFEYWQYTQEGKVDGIGGMVDCNIQLKYIE